MNRWDNPTVIKFLTLINQDTLWEVTIGPYKKAFWHTEDQTPFPDENDILDAALARFTGLERVTLRGGLDFMDQVRSCIIQEYYAEQTLPILLPTMRGADKLCIRWTHPFNDEDDDLVYPVDGPRPYRLR